MFSFGAASGMQMGVQIANLHFELQQEMRTTRLRFFMHLVSTERMCKQTLVRSSFSPYSLPLWTFWAFLLLSLLPPATLSSVLQSLCLLSAVLNLAAACLIQNDDFLSG